MCVNPRPTRAEVTDVATAIRQGASAVMLSGETASGNYPLEAIQTMHRIAESVEEDMTLLERAPALAKFRSTRAVANAAVELAIGGDVRRMIVATEHCTAPRLVASYRPKCAITAMTHRIRACRRSTIFPGVDTVLVDELESSRDTLELATTKLQEDGRLCPGDRIVTVTGSPLAMSGASNTIRLMKISDSGELSDLE
jgi:pyruvate kinase